MIHISLVLVIRPMSLWTHMRLSMLLLLMMDMSHIRILMTREVCVINR